MIGEISKSWGQKPPKNAFFFALAYPPMVKEKKCVIVAGIAQEIKMLFALLPARVSVRLRAREPLARCA